MKLERVIQSLKKHFLQKGQTDRDCDSLSSWRSQNYKTHNDVIVSRPDWGLWLRSPCWGEGGDLPSGWRGQPPLRHHGGLHCLHCPLVQGEHGPALLHVSTNTYRLWSMLSWCIFSFFSCYFSNNSYLVFGSDILSNSSDILYKYPCIVYVVARNVFTELNSWYKL